MSLADCGAPGNGSAGDPLQAAARRALHRLRVVRRQQGISRRSVARRLDVDVALVKAMEDETADMPLSQLYLWQEALEVPIAELLVESDDELAAPIRDRAQLVRLMKTAGAILETARQPAIRRMARNLVDQLIQIMPELEHIAAWHHVGTRRRRTQYGAAAQRRLPGKVFACRKD